MRELSPPQCYCAQSKTYPCARGKCYYGRGPLQLSWYGMVAVRLHVLIESVLVWAQMKPLLLMGSLEVEYDDVGLILGSALKTLDWVGKTWVLCGL